MGANRWNLSARRTGAPASPFVCSGKNYNLARRGADDGTHSFRASKMPMMSCDAVEQALRRLPGCSGEELAAWKRAASASVRFNGETLMPESAFDATEIPQSRAARLAVHVAWAPMSGTSSEGRTGASTR